MQAVALASLLSLLRCRWRQLSGTHVQQSLAAAGASGPAPAAAGGAGPLSQLHQQLQHAAAGGASSHGAAATAGAAAIGQTVALLQEYIAGAASGQVVLAAADVRLVLEELYELQVRCCKNQGVPCHELLAWWVGH